MKTDRTGRTARERYALEFRKARKSLQAATYAAPQWRNYRSRRSSKSGRNVVPVLHNTMALLVVMDDRRFPWRTFGRTSPRPNGGHSGTLIPTGSGMYRKGIGARDVLDAIRCWGKGSEMHRSALRNWREGLHLGSPYRVRLP